jgi:RimJ/RimL family protein N-acetyltransferase
MSVTIRRAGPDDADFLHALSSHEDVDPYLAARRDRSRAGLVQRLERSAREPEEYGCIVFEMDGVPAGTVTYERVNERSAIAELSGLAVHPDFRGRGVGREAAAQVQRYLIRELGFHRLQLEVYGFNERAIAHAERAGFTREGVRRRAYRRGDGWVDGVLFGFVAEDLDGAPDSGRST